VTAGRPGSSPRLLIPLTWLTVYDNTRHRHRPRHRREPAPARSLEAQPPPATRDSFTRRHRRTGLPPVHDPTAAGDRRTRARGPRADVGARYVQIRWAPRGRGSDRPGGF